MDNINISNQEKKAPLGVKIIAIVLFIFLIYINVSYILDFIGGMREDSEESGWLLFIGGPFLFVLILITCLLLFVDIMFWKGKNWARIILLIFFAIVMSYNLPTLWDFIISPYSLSKYQVLWFLTNIIATLFSLIAWIYLPFNKKCKEFFKNNLKS